METFKETTLYLTKEEHKAFKTTAEALDHYLTSGCAEDISDDLNDLDANLTENDLDEALCTLYKIIEIAKIWH